MNERLPKLMRARALLDAGRADEAYALADEELENNPNDPEALWVAALILEKSTRLPIAYHLARRVTELKPDRFAGWCCLGRIADQLWRITEAEASYKHALKVTHDDREKALALTNLGALYINIGQFAAARGLLDQALILDPKFDHMRHNLGICQLAAHDWAEGWKNYAYSLGTEARKKIQYAGEPEWDGEPGKNVILYGEQGVGDEIAFASMVPDALAVARRIVLDCDPKLAGLFRRSFPHAKVYGHRFAKAFVADATDRPEASLSFGALGALYRNADADFPGTPYLVPDPDRVYMWRSLFDQKAKPVIGIAWSGGVKHTGERFRRWRLEDMLPIFRAVDAHWVSLQYKDAEEEIRAFRETHSEIDIVQYRQATLTDDYDDTAGMVAALDRVICVQTAVAHLSGAIGKECWVLVAKTSQWRYGQEGEQIPWYKALRIFRQARLGEWEPVMNEVAGKLRAQYAREKRLIQVVA